MLSSSIVGGSVTGPTHDGMAISATTIKEKVEQYFEDIPIMVEIAQCESRFIHYVDSGNVLRGEENRYDVGVMQINEKYHLKDSKKLNLDIHTLEGNLAYARHLYDKYGTKPWVHSKKCWGTSTLALAR